MSQTELNASILRIRNYVHGTSFEKLIYMKKDLIFLDTVSDYYMNIPNITFHSDILYKL